MEKKRMILPILAAFLLIPLLPCSLAAYMESVHKDWHVHGDSFIIDGVKFDIKTSGSGTKALVSVDNNGVIVENGTCVDQFDMSICLNNVDYPEDSLHKLFDPEDYKYYIEIKFYLAKLSIDRSIEKTSLIVGEKTKVESTITNDGSLEADDVMFMDSYPYFQISNVFGCSFDRHSASWSGILRKGQSKICTYYIEAEKPGSYKTEAKATYLEGIGTREGEAESGEITLTVPEYEMEILGNASNSTVMVGDAFSFNATIRNTRSDSPLNFVTFSIRVPQGIDVKSYSQGLSASGDRLRWSGTLQKSEKKEFRVNFTARYSGKMRITAEANYRIQNLERTIALNTTVNSAIEGLVLQYISLPEQTVGGNSTTLVVNVNNPGGRYNFKNLKASITTNLPFIFAESSSASLEGRRFWNIVSKNVTFPLTEDITHYSMQFNVAYESEYGEKLSLAESRTIDVNPLKKPVAKSPEGAFKAAVKKEIEVIGTEKSIFIALAIGMVFLFSLFIFIAKMVKKVHEYEEYEK